MFNQLDALIENSQRLVITVDKVNGQLIVSTNAIVANADTEKSNNLLSALSTPFVVGGSSTDLDAHFSSELSQYVDSFSRSIGNLDTVTANMAVSSATAPKATQAKKEKAVETVADEPQVAVTGEVDCL